MKKAFTLVEMLVAIVLITLLIGVAIFSFRMQLLTISKIKTDSIESVLKYNQIKSTLESIKQYVVRDYDMLQKPMDSFHYFFKGTTTSALFISTNPIYTESDALVKLTCIDHKLIYKEEPLFKRINYLQPDFLPDSHQFTIYKNLDKCSFYYLITQKKLVKKISGKIPMEIYLQLKQDDADISIYSKIKNDDNLTKARIINEIYYQK